MELLLSINLDYHSEDFQNPRLFAVPRSQQALDIISRLTAQEPTLLNYRERIPCCPVAANQRIYACPGDAEDQQSEAHKSEYQI